MIISIIASMANERTIGSHRLFRHVDERAAMLLGERLADRLQVVARIEPFRNGADVLAQRLAIAQECRAREHVHLPARIVDVVFARDVIARESREGSRARRRTRRRGNGRRASDRSGSPTRIRR